MTASLWLRISAVISFLLAAGHTLGGQKYWSPMGDNAVLQAMRSTHFRVMAVERSYLNFYLGFGYSISILQIMQAALLWQLATLASSNPNATRPMIAVIALAATFCGIVSFLLILPLPAMFSVVLLASLVVSYVLTRQAIAAPGPQS